MALEEMGLSPLEVIRCTTGAAARIVGLGDEVGSIEPGLVADLILVPRNPLKDLECLREVRTIWKGERLVHNRSADDLLRAGIESE